MNRNRLSPRAGWTIQILDETSRSRRLIPCPGHLVASYDARVSANAVKSLWGLDVLAV